MPNRPHHPPKTAWESAFTLIELLVVIAIISLLVGLLTPMVMGALDRGRTINELALARNLIIGIHNYAGDHGGNILPGYRNDLAMGPDGQPLPFPTSARYPWRLMPYAGGVDKRIMWADGRGRNTSIHSADAYAVSLTPTLGMNVFFVGGDDTGNSGQGIRPTAGNFARFGKFCVTRMDEAYDPSRLVVFASARMNGSDGKIIPGYFMVQAPRIAGVIWSGNPFDSSLPPGQHGYVDFRHQNHALVAHLDGNVRQLGENELRDMRRWSNLAALADDPSHSLGR
ncbi:MAG TPA: type II secretion system protein [Kiritimatiellia bacterium]|nr:type II secretion system protein [Kiritimatiellia bacterium]HMO98368.1 type II secretion system protein [Kiritimatiellia bacterium]